MATQLGVAMGKEFAEKADRLSHRIAGLEPAAVAGTLLMGIVQGGA